MLNDERSPQHGSCECCGAEGRLYHSGRCAPCEEHWTFDEPHRAAVLALLTAEAGAEVEP